MWSMGCIVLEFIVWVVFGTQQLDNFNRRIVNEFGNPCHYFEMAVENGQACPKVHTVVCEMMGKLARTPACQPGRRALGDLLGVVRTKLLVVRLEQTASDSNRPQEFHANTQITRAHAVTLRVSLDDIIRTGNQNPSYWAKGETTDDNSSSLCTSRAVNFEQVPQEFLTVARKRSAGSVGGLLTSRSASLVVPVLTGSIGVG